MDSGMYTEREMQCVKEGIGAVRSVLSGTDTEAKRRLLFYLDWYMDPYYKQDISGIKNDLKEMLEKVNALGIGPQGFGGRTTALAVNILTSPTHIAALPVAVNLNCHVTRHVTEVL